MIFPESGLPLSLRIIKIIAEKGASKLPGLKFLLSLHPLYVIAVGKRDTRYIAFCSLLNI
jgi:hypothetical protein